MTGPALAGLATELREIQVPVLSVMLLGACAAKLARVARAGSLEAGLGPTELFPARFRGPATVLTCACEVALGGALILTALPAAGQSGSRPMAQAAAAGTRVATAVFFLVAMSALAELRQRRPELGCGCFGQLSARPVDARSVARAGLLAVAALSTIGGPALYLPAAGAGLLGALCFVAAEFAVIAALSPEADEALVRLGYQEPCELRTIPAGRTLAALRRSRPWRGHAPMITSAVPADVWRELCWRYVVFPARHDGAAVQVVFAVQMKKRHPAVRSAIVREPQAADPAASTAPGGRPAETRPADVIPSSKTV